MFDRVAGGQAPAAVFLVAQQCGEYRGGVEAWQAQPVERAIAADQSGAAAIAKQGIVFDVGRHWGSFVWLPVLASSRVNPLPQVQHRP
ncbi:hypothetical protein D3C77_711620 [compost metagenome]